jgi:outer membrane usher protein
MVKSFVNRRRAVPLQARTGARAAHPVMALVLASFTIAATARPAGNEAARTLEFDTTYLRIDPDRVDIARLARSNYVAPGVYPVDIWVNGSRALHDEVRFVDAGEGRSAAPCLTRAMLERAGVDFSRLAAARDEGADACVDLHAHMPDASVDFDFGEQKLALSIPQSFMRSHARGYVPPELWEDGVNAGFLSYGANVFQSSNDGARSTQNYLGLNAGVNLGGWHVRHQSSLTSSTGQPTQFDDIATYAQHDVPVLEAQATLGDAQTTGDVFDSVAFRGAQIATDDRMLPESLRGYAPVVRGTADSNARVTVRQNGQVIYETTVSPGPFEVRDLYPTGYGGNLDVTVTEADGRKKSFSVPYAAVAQSLRPGTTRFAFTAGQLRDEALHTRPAFSQFTLQRGLTNLVTAYGGGIVSAGYVAASLGAALNTKLGAFAGDLTVARTEIPGYASMSGRSVHVAYSKQVDFSDTNLTLGAYRYSSSGYLSLADAARARDYAMHGGCMSDRQRGRLQLTVNQPLRKHGSVYGTLTSQSYWNRSGRDTFYQIGYSNSFGYGTYSVSAGRTTSAYGEASDEIMVSTTIPLGHSPHAPLLSVNLNSGGGVASLQQSVSGSTGALNQYSYNVYGVQTRADGSSVGGSGGASGVYRAPYAQITASASGSAHAAQLSAGVSGSVVVHPGGVSLSQTVGDTFGIVEAKGAEGATVVGTTGVKIDARGYAVVPYLTPYDMNTIDIDPKGTSPDVEFESTSDQSAPHLGSIVMLRYRTMTGRAVLIRAPRLNGDSLPFGAEVSDANGRVVGVVAQDSRIFARGVDDSGRLVVKWGERTSEQCVVAYVLPRRPARTGALYASVEAHCMDARSAVTTAEAPSAVSR